MSTQDHPKEEQTGGLIESCLSNHLYSMNVEIRCIKSWFFIQMSSSCADDEAVLSLLLPLRMASILANSDSIFRFICRFCLYVEAIKG
jgi:hypothetical protein